VYFLFFKFISGYGGAKITEIDQDLKEGVSVEYRLFTANT